MLSYIPVFLKSLLTSAAIMNLPLPYFCCYIALKNPCYLDYQFTVILDLHLQIIVLRGQNLEFAVKRDWDLCF